MALSYKDLNGGPGKSKGILLIIVVKTYKSSQYLDGITIVVNFENCIKQLKYYFSNIIKVKERITAGEIIDLLNLTLQKDRRVNKKRRSRTTGEGIFNISK